MLKRLLGHSSATRSLGPPCARRWVFLFILLVAAPLASAQCTPHWIPGEGLPGTNGTVYATVPLPGGDVLVGGAFSMAGTGNANSLARWRASTQSWAPVGPGVSGSIYAMVPMPDGTVVVAGSFATAGGMTATNIARFNPTTGAWSTLGSGIVGNEVDALAVTPGGEVVAVGDFAFAGGVSVNGVARYFPITNTWASMNVGPTRGLHAVAAHPNGDIYVGGTFGPSGFSAEGIARWIAQSGSWTSLGSGLENGVASAIAILPNGDVLAGGPFTAAGGVTAHGLARWSITTNTWSAIPVGITGGAHTVNALLVLPAPVNPVTGDFVVGGSFTAPGSNLAWYHSNTGTWSALSSGLSGPATSLALIPGAPVGSPDILVGGGFASAGGFAASNIARVEHFSSTWGALGSGVDGAVNAMAVLPAVLGADVYAGGVFTRAGTGPAANIARFHPATNTWAPLGAGVDGPVNAIAILPSGDAIVGGSFANAGGVPAGRIARWNAGFETWTPLGSGIGVLPVAGQVLAITALPSGDVIVGGAFPQAGGNLASNIARWTSGAGGSGAWSTLGSGTDLSVYALAALPNGDVIAGGIFSRAGGVNANALARWSESTHQWSAIGSGVSASVYALLSIPNASGGTDVIVGGDFIVAGGVSANRIARWNPTTNTWSALGQGVDFQVNALALSGGSGGGGGGGTDLIVGGSFNVAGVLPANRIARWNFGTSAWAGLGTGLNAPVYAVASLPGGIGNGNVVGDILAGGSFTTAGGVSSVYLARWTVHPPCAADFDCNGTLNTQDIFAFLAAWFGGNPAADANGVNGLEVQDVFEYLNTWFAGC